MPPSLREIAQIMDPTYMVPGTPGMPVLSLRELANRHRWLSSQPQSSISMRTIVERHTDPQTRRIRFLHLNTYLLTAEFHVVDYIEKGVGGAAQLLLCLGVAGPREILRKAFDITGKQATCALLFPPPIPLLNPLYSACLALPINDVVDWLINRLGNAIDIALKLAVPTVALLQAFGLDLNVTVNSKRLVQERALETGNALIHDYDLISLVEVWRQETVDKIISAWGNNTPFHFRGNDRPGSLNYLGGAYKDLGSGLLVVSPGQPAAKVADKAYDVDGVTRNVGNCADLGPLVDSDRWAAKGILMTRIDAGVGTIELYTTHLYSGGDMLSWDIIGVPGETEKMNVRLEQVKNFVSFFQEHHDPRNVAMFTGDFNIEAGTPGYDGLVALLTNIPLPQGSTTSFTDCWLYGVSDPAADHRAGTSRNGDDDDPKREKDFSQVCHVPNAPVPQPPTVMPLDIYCDDRQPAARGRIDYIFVEIPRDTHTFNLDLTRIRRRTFRRRDDDISKQDEENEREYYLSDHLGLDMVLIASPIV